MSHVAALALSHFRSHKLARLAPGGRSVALYGPNGAGKTNLLEAVSMLSPGRGLRRAEGEALARRPESLGWRVQARIETPEGLHEVETGAEQPGASRSVRIDGKPAPQTRLGALLRMAWLTPSMDRLWTEGAAERRRFLDRTAMGFDPDHAEASVAYEKAMRERNRLLKDDVRDARWLDALEARMAASGAAVARARAVALIRLREAQAGAETAFPAAELTLEGAPDADAAAALAEGASAEEAQAGAEASLREALASGRGADYAAGRTLTGPHRADLRAVYAAKGIEARLCSTGEQKALLISLVLATARALAAQTGTPPLLLLDEVAAHLDEGRRAALYAEIRALGAQAWMTGTEAELFAALGEEALRVEVSEGEGGTILAPLD
ncbi:DNA replication/repair protein RecF [Albimonas sp. CAU 1670]|uniref:DNA replication/repair protein RecF n=1 Tax=Albimonas sp. CAU 1670 TaxID=3032599 RepID=UPI0023DA227B|nr:DNA replication/repair protein RecF [Albimonas sp. CAU 1670]MDF2231005.1 DNA replication/repair protein RecF [Albimonas sp. CAU 1670]